MEKAEALNGLRTAIRLKGLSDNTAKTYCLFNKRFLDSVNVPAEEVTRQDIEKFLASLIDKSPRTRALAISALRFFFKRINPNILADIETPKKGDNLPRVLSRAEVEVLIKSAGTDKARLILSLLYSSGLRVSELAGLKVTQVDLEKGQGIVKGKGGRERLFFFSKNLAAEISGYVKQNSITSYLFPGGRHDGGSISTRSIQRLVKFTARKAGIQKRVTPHMMRHSLATHHLEAGTDIRKIQVALGHKKIDTTTLYTHVSNKMMEEVKNPFDSLDLKRKREDI